MGLGKRRADASTAAEEPLRRAPDSINTRLMARSLGALYVAGGLLALAWVSLPHGEGKGDVQIRAAAMTALVIALWLLFGPSGHWTKWRLHLVILTIQVIVTLGYAANSQADGLPLMFYCWATPCTALFFSRRAAALHTVWVAALLAVTLRATGVPLGQAAAIWLLTIGTVIAVGTIVAWVTSAMRRRDGELWHQTRHDELTGLPNRQGFAEHVAHAIATRPVGHTVAVLLIDLDRFQFINDTYGHHAGDELLVALAPRLRAVVRSQDCVARFGGDEFAILVHGEGPFDADDLASRIATTWQRPLDTRVGTLFTSGCVGIALARRTDDTPQRLLRDADSALYRAKGVGPGNFQLFDERMREGTEHRLRLEQDLREAIARNQLHVVYQPVIDLSTGEMSSVEALLRWTHPELGAIPPDAFIPLAEASGLIGTIGSWVLDQTALQLAAWRSANTTPVHFAAAVNVSSAQLRAGFAASVAAALARHDLPPSALTVELTESALIDARAETTLEMTKLRELGLRLVLDDFGTGYSSLSYLQNIPLDGLKIDRSFVSRITETTDAPIVEAIVMMARTLGLRTVAEGIETPAQRERLRALGCDLGQGYLFSRPVPACDIDAHFAQQAAAS